MNGQLSRMAKYLCQAFHQRKRIFKSRAFKRGDLVFQCTLKEGKLKQNWEDPCIITDDGSKGAYQIQSKCDKMEAHPWNSSYLKKYFQ